MGSACSSQSGAAKSDGSKRRERKPSGDSTASHPILSPNASRQSMGSTMRPEGMKAGALDDADVKWSQGQVLGKGAYGTVFLALNHNNGMLMAVKELIYPEKARKEWEKMQREIALMKALDHVHIVKYYGSQIKPETANDGTTVIRCLIFLQYVPGGSLMTMLETFGQFDEKLVKLYAKQMLRGLAFLHANGVVHRDIKTANVLMDDMGVIKLADFGASLVTSSTVLTNVSAANKEEHLKLTGTPYFMAPETIQPSLKKAQGETVDMDTLELPSYPADIWALGGTLLHLASGKPPWKDMGFQKAPDLLVHIATSTAPPAYPPNISPEFKDFLDMCFERDPNKRAGAEKLLQHEFVHDVTDIAQSVSTTSAFAPATPSAEQDAAVADAVDIDKSAYDNVVKTNPVMSRAIAPVITYVKLQAKQKNDEMPPEFSKQWRKLRNVVKSSMMRAISNASSAAKPEDETAE